jgi:branched-chain amino acid transport system ATP-binding protein
MLKVDDIHTFYGVSHVIQGISLEINEGEIVCLIGRNGAGKTTTLRSIMGLTPSRSGSIKFKGAEISGKRPHLIARMGIGYVPENRRIFPNITVGDNLDIVRSRGRQYRLGSQWTLERVYTFFPTLEKLDKRKGNELSGGEQQMLTIARTLMVNPELLLIDEMSEGLAPIIVYSLTELVQKLKHEITIFLVEQNATFAFSVSNRGYVIDKGRICYHGAIEALKENEEVKQRYLAV